MSADLCNSNSIFRLQDDEINLQNSILYNQQFEILELYKIIFNISNDLHQLQSVISSRTHASIFYSRPNSTNNFINHHYTYQPFHSYLSSSQISEQIRYLQDAFQTAHSTLERLDLQNHNLRKECDELLYFQSISSKTPSTQTASTPDTVPVPSQNSHSSAFIPVVISKSQTVILPTNTSTSTPVMPFTLSLTSTLPSFSGKEDEKSRKLINWLFCYSNPNGSDHQPKNSAHLQQPPFQHMLSSRCSLQHFHLKHHYQQPNQHDFINQQPSHQYYSTPQLSLSSAPPRSPTLPDG